MGRAEWTTTTAFLRDLDDFRNDAGWRRFVARYERAVRAFIRRMGAGGADEDDVLQDVMLSVARGWRNRTFDRTKGRLRSWVFRIAYRRIVDARAARSAAQPSEAPASNAMEHIPDRRTSETVFEREWRAALVGAAVARLREEASGPAFRVFERLVLEERSAPEVAAELGMTPNAVYQTKFRMLRRLAAITGDLAVEP